MKNWSKERVFLTCHMWKETYSTLFFALLHFLPYKSMMNLGEKKCWNVFLFGCQTARTRPDESLSNEETENS